MMAQLIAWILKGHGRQKEEKEAPPEEPEFNDEAT